MKRTVDEVLELAAHPRKAHRTPRMRSVGPKTRLITPPRRDWKMPLRWLGVFLRREFPLHPAAHGSVPGCSPFTAASRHLGRRNLLSRDVKNAFPNVKASRFYLEMLALGFSREMASLLTKLLLPDGYIPQGGPASNAAIDLFFYRIDCDIEREISAFAARYTRFTDNLDASFRDPLYAEQIGLIIERNLARLGLSINSRKVQESGWQPVGRERTVCGVRVNSPKGTQLPRDVAKRLFDSCERLYRGARSVAPHTLPGLARRRRSLQGWLNQSSQADIAPIGDLQRRLHQADFVVLSELRKHRIFPNHEWYTRGKYFDEASDIAALWARRRMLATASTRRDTKSVA